MLSSKGVSEETNSGINKYKKVIVTVTAKNPFSAVTLALDTLDLQRGIWCWLGNPEAEMTSRDWVPINRIRIGETHTIHEKNGRLTTDGYWSEPNFVPASLFASPRGEFDYHSNRALSKINLSPYKDTLVQSLLRYVRALDERDPNVGIVKLWSALESLASPNNANYEEIVRRVSFLYENPKLHYQILGSLRDIRNRNVHAGDQIERARPICFLLSRYFWVLLRFHINKAEDFKSLEEANMFLSLPAQKSTLEQRQQLISKAIKFVG